MFINEIIIIEPIKINGTLITNLINIAIPVSKLVTSLIIRFTMAELPILFNLLEGTLWIWANNFSRKVLLYPCEVIAAIYCALQAKISPNNTSIINPTE